MSRGFRRKAGFFSAGRGVSLSSFRRKMRFVRPILCLLFLAGALLSGPSAFAANAQAEAASGSTRAEAKQEEKGVSQQAVEIARPFGFPITNSMVVTWIVALGLILFAQLATRDMKEVPEGAQNFWEWMVESLHDFLDGIIGHHLVHRTFWFFATIFIFILFSNWAGLIPGLGTVGWKVQQPDGTTELIPWFRGANADLNMTLAMALVFFGCWLIWAVQEVGPVGFLLH